MSFRSHRLKEVRVHAVDKVKREGRAILLQESPADEVQDPHLTSKKASSRAATGQQPSRGDIRDRI